MEELQKLLCTASLSVGLAGHMHKVFCKREEG